VWYSWHVVRKGPPLSICTVNTHSGTCQHKTGQAQTDRHIPRTNPAGDSSSRALSGSGMRQAATVKPPPEKLPVETQANNSHSPDLPQHSNLCGAVHEQIDLKRHAPPACVRLLQTHVRTSKHIQAVCTLCTYTPAICICNICSYISSRPAYQATGMRCCTLAVQQDLTGVTLPHIWVAQVCLRKAGQSFAISSSGSCRCGLNP
jgi:hypothetical protein